MAKATIFIIFSTLTLHAPALPQLRVHEHPGHAQRRPLALRPLVHVRAVEPHGRVAAGVLERLPVEVAQADVVQQGSVLQAGVGDCNRGSLLR